MTDNPVREAEQFLLGSAFLDNSLAVTLELEPQDFGDGIHAKLWSLARMAVERGGSFAAGPIMAAAPEIASYVEAVAGLGSQNRGQIDQWVAMIREASVRRRLKELAEGLAYQADDQEVSPEELVADFIGQAAKLSVRRTANSKRRVATQICEEMKNPLPCYSTGLKELDKSLGGGLFQNKVVGIAARKKVGKTVLLGTISHNLNRVGVTHGFIALEMSPAEIEQRNIARELGINSMKFLTRDDRTLADRVAKYSSDIPNCTIFEHLPGGSFDQVRRAIASMVTNYSIKGVLVDYWQLVSGKERGESEEYHLRSVAQWLADFCRQKQIFGVIAAQVNQEGNTRGGEGLKLACDIYFTLHREKSDPWAWLEMEESRYVLYRNVGSAGEPGLILEGKGPYFSDPAAISNHDDPAFR